VFGGCVVHCGHHDYDCEGPGCHDDGYEDGYPDDGWEDDGVPRPDGGGGQGQGGEGGGPIQTCDATDVQCACDAEIACPSDLTCVSGVCISACSFDYDCGPGKVCGNGECVPACTEDTPCGLGYGCLGGGCLPDPSNPQCTVEGEVCEVGGTCIGGFCTTSCTTHADCGTGKLCNGLTNTCVADNSPVALCDSAELTCPGQGQTCLSGVCHYECAEITDCKLIDARFDYCDRGFCKTEIEMNPECTASNPCGDGVACVSNVCVLP
jgi:hypothetical protein